MEDKNVTTTTTATTTTTTVSNSGNKLEKFGKPLLIGAGAIVLIVAGWLGYKELYKAPKEQKANEAIFMAERLFGHMTNAGFSKDSSIIVLNGGALESTNITGVLKVISSNGGTQAANRAEFIAGATYLHLGEFEKAIKHLKNFKGNGAHQIEAQAHTMMGHAYAELNKTGDALAAYKKAAKVNPKDETVTPQALFIAASYAEAIEKNDDAKELYQELKSKFPSFNAVRSGDVDKFLARLGEMK